MCQVNDTGCTTRLVERDYDFSLESERDVIGMVLILIINIVNIIVVLFLIIFINVV